MAAMSRRKLLAFRLISIVLAVVVGFGLAEAVLRAFPSLIGVAALSRFEPHLREHIADRLGLPTLDTWAKITPEMRSDHGPTIYLPAPNSLVVTPVDPVDRELGAIATAQMDENGLCNVQPIAHDKVDVLLTGDSFTFCTAVRPDQTSSQQLHDLSGLKVYNIGNRSTGPWEYLEMAKRYTPLLHPSVVVMNIYEGNDLRDVIRYNNFVEEGEQRRGKIRKTTPAHSYALQFLAAGIGLLHDRLFPKHGRNFRYEAEAGGRMMAMNVTNRDQDEVKNAVRVEQGRFSMDLFEPPMHAFISWARANGVTPVVTYIPSMYTAYDDTVKFEDPKVGTEVKTFSKMQRQWFAADAAAQGYAFLDLTPAFQAAARDGVITHFPANVHLTPQGHAIVARGIWSILSKGAATQAQ